MLETITTFRRDALAALLSATAQAVGGGRPHTLGPLARRVDLVSALLDAVEALDAAEADEAPTLAGAERVHDAVYRVTRDVVEAVSHDTEEARWYEPLYLLVSGIRNRANALGAKAAKRAAEKPCEAPPPGLFDEEGES